MGNGGAGGLGCVGSLSVRFENLCDMRMTARPGEECDSVGNGVSFVRVFVRGP